MSYNFMCSQYSKTGMKGIVVYKIALKHKISDSESELHFV